MVELEAQPIHELIELNFSLLHGSTSAWPSNCVACDALIRFSGSVVSFPVVVIIIIIIGKI